MKTVMLAWIGGTDHDAADDNNKKFPGPIARATRERTELDGIHLLNNYENKKSAPYKKWLRAMSETKARITTRDVKLDTPTEFGGIYSNVLKEIDTVVEHYGSDVKLIFNLSAGTYGMAAVWVILQQTLYPDADVIEASPEGGVKKIEVPFDISADYVPDLMDRINRSRSEADRAYVEAVLGGGSQSKDKEFKNMIYRCAAMKMAIGHAQRIASRSIPVLIEGEAGTGKHLLAGCMHKAGQMSGNLQRVACGAMPPDQLEQELFGYEEGARKVRPGALEKAGNGTLFLSEVDTLPAMLQVKLLRALEDNELTRVGGNKAVKLKNIRCISATNRQLNRCVAEETFRSDLYYKLVGDVIVLPPLRERTEDLEPLIDFILEDEGEVLKQERGLDEVRLSAGAKNVIKRYHWPGNIRELRNVLVRVATHTDRIEIRPDDIRYALQLAPVEKDTEILNRTFSEDFRLEDVLDEVSRHYVNRAKEQTGGRITRMAKLLGYEHYQMLRRKMVSLGIRTDG